ncbi:sulfatase [Pontiellaceae bacterium B12227]|nr:sulfatase [Pontiellaceae bacterium B12227]
MKKILSALCAVALGQCFAQPNFVFFLADDISQEDIGCYGHPSIRTPNIDRLAGEGLRFDNAILTTSSCSPSRCSMITGRYPHNTGAPELHVRLPEGQPLFPLQLKEAGYYTVLSGKDHMGSNAHPAFSLVSKGKGPGAEEDWLQIAQERPKDKPFFFWFASKDAHRGWQINDDAPIYTPEAMTVPPFLVDGPKTRNDLTGYAHEVSRFDHYIGLVTAELEKQGVLEDTVIIITADNGRPFPRCKTRLYDSGIKPPFVVHNKKRVKQGTTGSLVSSIDISATVLDLAGVEKDERIQGISFLPILGNPNAVTREVAFSEHNWHVFKNHERSVRFGDWLYIKNNFPNQQNLCMEAKNAELEEGFKAGTLTDAQRNIFRNPCPEEELFQLSKDPDQLTNLVQNPEYFQILEKARALLAQWSVQTGDTIPENPTPDRNARPGQPKPEGKHKHLEMPGDASNAWKMNHPGPVLL